MYSRMTIVGAILMQSARMQTLDQKEQILKYFTEVDGQLCLVIATAAFGMDIVPRCPESLALEITKATWRNISRKMVEQDNIVSSLWQCSMMQRRKIC